MVRKRCGVKLPSVWYEVTTHMPQHVTAGDAERMPSEK